MQTAVASLLGRPLHEVPDFWARGTDGWWDVVEAFFERQGFVIESFAGEHAYGGYYLAYGPDPRGHSHVVVMKDGAMAHDPNPSNEGIVRQEGVYIVRPADPAEIRRVEACAA